MKVVRTKEGDELCDADGNCIADLNYFIGYDENNDSLIFLDGGLYYSIPVYSYSDLLAAADEYLAGEE